MDLAILLFSYFFYLKYTSGILSNKLPIYLNEYKNNIFKLHPSYLSVIIRLFLFFIFYYYRKILIKKCEIFYIILNGYFIGILLYLMFANSIITIISRGNIYFYIMESLLLPLIFYIIRNKINKNIMLIFIFIFSILLFYKSIQIIRIFYSL